MVISAPVQISKCEMFLIFFNFLDLFDIFEDAEDIGKIFLTSPFLLDALYFRFFEGHQTRM